MEVKRGQLVDDDAHRDILPLPSVDTRHKTVEDQGIERPDDTLHLRVVGNEQVTGMLRVAHLQVEVITLLTEYPVRLLGRQSGGEHTQRSDHSFQLLHGLVLKSRTERSEQGSHLRVGHQHLEDGLVALVEKREDMRHVTVFTQPISRLTDVAPGIADDARGLDHPRLRIDGLVISQFPAMLIVGPLLIVAEKIDARSEEVDRRGLEKLVAAASTLFLAFL